MPENYLSRLHKIDSLIQKKSTGTPQQLARRLGLSKSRMYDYINAMKKRGAPIEYDKNKRTYYYKQNGSFFFHFKINTIDS